MYSRKYYVRDLVVCQQNTSLNLLSVHVICVVFLALWRVNVRRCNETILYVIMWIDSKLIQTWWLCTHQCLHVMACTPIWIHFYFHWHECCCHLPHPCCGCHLLLDAVLSFNSSIRSWNDILLLFSTKPFFCCPLWRPLSFRLCWFFLLPLILLYSSELFIVFRSPSRDHPLPSLSCKKVNSAVTCVNVVKCCEYASSGWAGNDRDFIVLGILGTYGHVFLVLLIFPRSQFLHDIRR